MKKFDVEITETLQRKVSVEAASQEDAERMVTQAWNNQDYVLDSGDFTGVDFKTVGEHELAETRTMDVLLVQPNAYPKKISVGTELEDLQAMVGGDIEVTYPFEDEVAIILNESGKINGLPLNRAIYTEDGDKSSQQFITLVTKAGNTFYLIIDRDKDGNQNVHFLNMVDEADLLALMDEEEAAKYQEKEPEITEPAETEKPQETEPAPEEQKTESEQKKASPLPMIMLLLFVIGAAGVGGYLYIKMKGVKPASKKNQPDPDADYHDEDEDALQLPEDDGDEDEEVDVNEDYEAESDDEPV